jgi:alkyl hydroperoxide reductase subunit AhpC
MIRDRFEAEDAQVVGVSADSVPVQEVLSQTLGSIHYPLLSDYWPHGHVAETYGSLDPAKGHAERGTYLIDPNGILRWKEINDFNEPRDPRQILNQFKQIKSKLQ